MKNITEKKYLTRHPLDIWKSEEVTNLLIDFFSANFKKAGLSQKMARDFVLTAFAKRKTEDREKSRETCDRILLEAKEKAKNGPDEIEPLELFDFSGTGTFIDIGANKLATINYLAKKFKNIKKFIGVDTNPRRNDFSDPKKSAYFQVDPKANNFPVKNDSVDFINLQFVLHHFLNLGAIKKTLADCRKILKPNGALLLWEESFMKNFDADMTRENNRLGIKTDKSLTEKFYALSEKKRWEFIVANDWLINVNNPHMPWTGQYYKWNEWINILREAGFGLEKEYNFGLRINGRIKQGVHILGLFEVR